MKSKTQIEKQLKNKTNPGLISTIIEAKKRPKWTLVAAIMSGPRTGKIQINLDKLSDEVKDGESVVIPGKVLSEGEMNRKAKIIALNFSERAKEKLLKAKCEISNIIEEIKKNPDARGIKILTNGRK
jgi:large subunit ribosomal protein L18e